MTPVNIATSNAIESIGSELVQTIEAKLYSVEQRLLVSQDRAETNKLFETAYELRGQRDGINALLSKLGELGVIAPGI